MLPLPQPRFDPRPAIARMQDDRTDMLRELHPDLHWVWDQMDELREGTDERVTTLEKMLDRAFEIVGDMIDDIDLMEPIDPNPLVGIRDRLDNLAEYLEDR